MYTKSRGATIARGGGMRVRGLPSPSLFSGPQDCRRGGRGNEKQSRDAAPTLGHVRIGPDRAVSPRERHFLVSPSAMSLSLPLKASEDVTGPGTRAPSGVSNDFPIHMRKGIGALPEGTEVWTRGRSGW